MVESVRDVHLCFGVDSEGRERLRLEQRQVDTFTELVAGSGALANVRELAGAMCALGADPLKGKESGEIPPA